MRLYKKSKRLKDYENFLYKKTIYLTDLHDGLNDIVWHYNSSIRDFVASLEELTVKRREGLYDKSFVKFNKKGY